MKVIIAEKPSLAKNIMAAIGTSGFKKEDGYFESSEYIVTWAFGHLFGLYDIEEYSSDDDEKTGWTLEGLPFRPLDFRFGLRKDNKTKKADTGVKKQFGVIKKLCSRQDVKCVVNAGDADREGEIIVRIILEQAGNKKPVMRLWMPDQTAETIRAELRSLKSDSEYDNLANEGYARTYIDWLYGVNLTRLATLKSGTLLRVGRVIVPIVKAIYDRDMEIRNFVPKQYYGVVSKEKTYDEEIELVSKKTFEPSDVSEAKKLCESYNATGAKVTDIKTEEKTVQPGKLYSLSKLQGVLGKTFKMSPKESLAIVQTLYEAGYVTYPRTNSEYLATAEKGKINAVVEKLVQQGYKVCPKDQKRSIYDDSKIESHSALTPTTKLAKQSDLKEKEWQVYSTILNRFLAVFCSEECKVDRTVITIEVGSGLEIFKLKGDVFKQKGWMQYDNSGRSDKILPKLSKGDTVNIDFKPVEKETTPPKHYTVDSLNNFLKNPFKNKSNEDEASEHAIADDEGLSADDQEYAAIFEGVEIGTEATRTGIIENAIKTQYIALKNNVYTILPGGEFFIQSLHKLGIEMEKEKTAELGKLLKRVYKGEVNIEDSVTMAYQQVKLAFNASSGVNIDRSDIPKGVAGAEPVSLGKCPKCGGDVVERAKLFGCSNKECKFGIWKNDKFFAGLGRKPTAAIVKSLLSKGKVSLKNCVSQKSGKKFDCTVSVDFNGQWPKYDLSFLNNSSKR